MVGEDTLISAEDSVSDRLPYLAHRNYLKGPACKNTEGFNIPALNSSSFSAPKL